MEKMFTTENFDVEVLQSDVPVLVDFYADWCSPCKRMAPVIEELAKEFDGKAKVGKLNVEESDAIAGKYGVMSIPTLIVIKGGQVVDKFIGEQRKAALAEALNKAL